MESILADVRYVSRSFARNPAFFLVTALTLALGIGATTAIFSVVNGVLLQPLPYPKSEQVAQLFGVDTAGGHTSLAEPNFIDWQQQSRGFSAMAMTRGPQTISASGFGEPIRARSTTVTRDFFQSVRTVYGIRAHLC